MGVGISDLIKARQKWLQLGIFLKQFEYCSSLGRLAEKNQKRQFKTSHLVKSNMQMVSTSISFVGLID